MTALIPLVFAERGTDRRALRALYPLISEDAPTTEIHVAMEGTWEGHPSGPFSLTRDDFETIVRNFEASPNPIPLDYEHATEWADKAPACGWVQGLSVRNGGDGKAHLFAKVELSDEAAEYIRAGAYRFSSGVFVFDAIDNATGDDIGVEMTSLALTNMPFITGQQPIQLSRRAARASAAAKTRSLSMDMTEVPKDALMDALSNLDKDSVTAEDVMAAAQYAAAQEGSLGGDEPAEGETPAADEPPDVPATDEPADPPAAASDEDPDAVPAADEPAGDQVAAAEDDMPGAEGDQALAALAPIAEAAGMSVEEVAAALMENRDAVVSAIQGGGGEEDGAGAPMSDREAQLALSARDTTIRTLSTQVDKLEAYRREREEADADAFVEGLLADGRITDEDRAEWKALALSNRKRAEKLAPKARVVPTSAHASGHTPPTEGSPVVEVDESDPHVVATRASLSRAGITGDRQTSIVRNTIAARQNDGQARA